MMINFKTIRARLLFYFVPVTIAVLLVAGFLLGFFSMEKTVELSMKLSTEIAKTSEASVEEWLGGVVEKMTTLSLTSDIREGKKSVYQPLFKAVIANSDGEYEMMFFSDLSGKAFTEDDKEMDLSQRDYIQQINSGASVAISNALISKDSGNPIFVVAVPVKDKGKLTGVLGVAITLNELSEKLNQIRVGEAGFVFLSDGTGLTLSHLSKDMIMKFNPLESGKDGYEGLAEMAKEMTEGKMGNGVFKRPDGTSFRMIYGPIAYTPNWSMGVIIPTSQLSTVSDQLIMIILIAFAIITAVLIAVSWFTGNAIASPVNEIAKVIKRLSVFDLRFDENSKAVKYLKNKDEIGQMLNGIAMMQTNLIELVKTVNLKVSEVSESAENLSSVSQEQLATSEELSSQAQEVDHNVQNTSASIQEVTSGVEEVAASAQDVSRNSQELSNEIAETETAVDNGQVVLNTQDKMMKTVGEQNDKAMDLVKTVAEKANNVQEIVNTIASIAEQTNLLALNAAIEAARAGEAGKGFAVVADEIRKLAEESKTASGNIASILNEIDDGSDQANEAVKKTVELYGELNTGSLKLVEEFNRIRTNIDSVNSRVESLMGVAEEQSASAEEMASAMDNSARSTGEISEQVMQITKAVEQQTLGAQQVSSAAEQLNALSVVLSEQIAKFKV